MNSITTSPDKMRRPGKHNACLLCRRKRAKCNGKLPCERCAIRGEQCGYQDRVWRTKDDLRSEIAKLQDGVTQVLSLLQGASGSQGQGAPALDPNAVQELRSSDALSNVMSALGIDLNAGDDLLMGAGGSSSGSNTNTQGEGSSQGHRGSEASVLEHSDHLASTSDAASTASSPNDLASGPAYAPPMRPTASKSPPHSSFVSTPMAPTIKPWTTHAPFSLPSKSSTPTISATPTSPRECFLGDGSLSPFSSSSPPGPPRHPLSGGLWDFVDLDNCQIRKVIGVYLEWERPGYSAICAGPFLADLAAQRRRFCSQALVYAILARAYQMMECAGHKVDRRLVPKLYGRAQRMLVTEKPLLETVYPHIQTLTVLASIDVVIGQLEQGEIHCSEAARLAIVDALEKKATVVTDEEHLSVVANTFCGAVSLPRLLRLVLNRCDAMSAPLFMRLSKDVSETADARIERGMALQQHFVDSLRWCPSRNRFSWEITQLTHTFMMFHFDEDSNSVNKSDLFDIYPKLQECWERWMKEPENRELSPGKIYNCAQYHFSIISIFRPYMNDPTLAATIRPRAVLSSSAQAVVDLFWLFKTTWGLGLVHLGMPYILGLAVEVELALGRQHDASLLCGNNGVDLRGGGSHGPGNGNGNGNATRPMGMGRPEITCKGIMALAELAPHHYSAQSFLSSVSKQCQ